MPSRSAAREGTWLDRALAILAPVAVATWLCVTLANVLVQTAYGWNNARLAPAIALLKGYRLYSGPDAGPVLNTVYGPVVALAYLPAGAAGTPTAAILAGALVSVLWYYVPALWSIRALPGVPPAARRLLAPLAAACFGLATCGSYPLWHGAHRIHADAPALGLLAAACAALLAWRAERPWLLTVSALCAVLAVWTKQSTALGLLSLQLYVAVAFGAAAGRRWFWSAAAATAATSGFFFALFNPADLLFNMVTIPSHHPLSLDDAGHLLLLTLKELFDASAFEVGVLSAGVLAIAAVPGGAPEAGLRGRLSRHRWSVFAFVGVGNAPAAVLNRMKAGGDLNAFNIVLYFLLIATILMLVELSCAAGDRDATLSRVAKAALAGACAALLLQAAPLIPGVPGEVRAAARNRQAAGFELVREHPGEVYLPNQPLSHLLAEGKLYHFSYGLADRRLAGRPVSPGHFRAHLPPRVKLVLFDDLFPGEDFVEEVMPYLPEFAAAPATRGGWTVFETEGGAAIADRIPEERR